MNRIKTTLLVTIVFATTYFGVVRTIFLTQFDYFAYSSWGLAIEINRYFRLPLNHYVDCGISWCNHPLNYQYLFYPHVLLSIISQIATIPVEYSSLIIILLFTILTYMTLRQLTFLLFTSKMAEGITIYPYILLYVLFVVSSLSGYPSFAFYYISIGMVTFWFILYLILRQLTNPLQDKKAYMALILMFIITSNWSYYTSTFLIGLFAASMYILLYVAKIFISVLFGSREIDVIFRGKTPYILIVSVISLGLLLYFNPIVTSLVMPPYDPLQALQRVFENILESVVSQRAYSIIEIGDPIYPILSHISRLSSLLLVSLFLLSLLTLSLKKRHVGVNIVIVVMIIGSLLLSEIPFATVYLIMGMPTLHSYSMSIALIIIMFSSIVWLDALLKMLRGVLNISPKLVKVLGFLLVLLAILPTLSTFYRTLIYDEVSVNPVSPKFFHANAQHVTRYVAMFSSHDSSYASDGRTIAQLYYELAKLNKVTKITYNQFNKVLGNFSYSDCTSRNCFYILAYMWKYVPFRGGSQLWEYQPPLGNLFDFMTSKSLGKIYDDGMFIVINTFQQ
ncbi:MAG: hypothetical protein ACP5IE_01455 [Infirmifilum sp.]